MTEPSRRRGQLRGRAALEVRLIDGVGVRRGAADQAQRADRRRRASGGAGSADDRPRRPSRAGGEAPLNGARPDAQAN